MRISTSHSVKYRGYYAGIRRCDNCNKEEFLEKTKNWNVCISCQKKDLYKTGKNVAPRCTKKVSLINYCGTCNNIFYIKSEYYRERRFCSNKCAGVLSIGKEPANKIWSTKKDRNRSYYNKRKKDINKKISSTIRQRIKSAVTTQLNRKNKKCPNTGKLEDIVGCSMQFLKFHIEQQFESGMSWDNWTNDGWHLDHIFPISRVDVIDREQLAMVSNWKNLRPLWAKSNFSKKAKIIIPLKEVLSKHYAYEHKGDL